MLFSSVHCLLLLNAKHYKFSVVDIYCKSVCFKHILTPGVLFVFSLLGSHFDVPQSWKAAASHPEKSGCFYPE